MAGDDRAKLLPVEPPLGYVAHVAQVALTERRDGKQARTQWLARIVEANERIELVAARPGASTAVNAPSLHWPEGFVEVMREEVKPAALVLIDVVIART